MNDFRNRIGTNVQGDEWRHFEFTRNTHLPHGTFGKRRPMDAYVFAACVVLLAVALIVVNITP